MALRITIPAVVFLAAASSGRVLANSAQLEMERGFAALVRPFIETYCVTCHGGEKPKADFDLSHYSTMESIVRDHRHWELVLEKLQAAEMPPEKAKQHPTPELRKRLSIGCKPCAGTRRERMPAIRVRCRRARLSNAEYDYTIRDLTGVDIRPTREFPVDPANQAGFDNSGESLAMSPALVEEVSASGAARWPNISFLTPDGLAFAPHPMMADTDRDKYCVLRIVDFYKRQPTDYAEYFQAAWRFKHRAALGRRKSDPGRGGRREQRQRKIPGAIWSVLNETREEVGPIGRIQSNVAGIAGAEERPSRTL